MGSTSNAVTTPAPTPAATPGPRPACEHPDFRLGRHPAGQWYKKIKGKARYFGAIAADPTGERAWAQYAQEKPFWEAGQDPRKIAREMGAERKVGVCRTCRDAWHADVPQNVRQLPSRGQVRRRARLCSR